MPEILNKKQLEDAIKCDATCQNYSLIRKMFERLTNYGYVDSIKVGELKTGINQEKALSKKDMACRKIRVSEL